MNSDLIDARKDAETLYSSMECPVKEDGRKIGVMELTKRFWDEKGYAFLCKTAQNLRDQYAKITKATYQPQQLLNEIREQNTSRLQEQSETMDRNVNNFVTRIERSSTEQYNQTEYSSLLKDARKLFEASKIRQGNGWSERQRNTFTKHTPKTDDLKILGNIATSLIKQDPKTNPCKYLWEYNCAVYSVEIAWKEQNEKQNNRKKENNNRPVKPKWLREMEKRMTELRKEISQITEEITRIKKNGKITSKLRRNRKWMRHQINGDIKIARLIQLKENKLSQLKLKKIEKDKK